MQTVAVGVQQKLHSYQGCNLCPVMAELCGQLRIRKTCTTPLHPQSDGLVERFNQTLSTQLAIATAAHQRDWDVQLPLILMTRWPAPHAHRDCLAPLPAMFSQTLACLDGQLHGWGTWGT